MRGENGGEVRVREDHAAVEDILMDPAWMATAMPVLAGRHATLLQNGLVLASDGTNYAELYNPATNTWSSPSQLPAFGQYGVASCRLSDGRVLSTGGLGGETSAEIYNPATNTWQQVASMGVQRVDHIQICLSNGKALVAGGAHGNPFNASEASAELYDPVANTWTPAGSMSASRAKAQAVLLDDGRALVTGGTHYSPYTYLSSVDIFDPATNTWSPASSMGTARSQHSAVKLEDGRVLVAGGLSIDVFSTVITAAAEIYDPAQNTWTSVASMGTPRIDAKMVLLKNGLALITGGGVVEIGSAISSTEAFDPQSGAWLPGSDMVFARRLHDAVTLPDGRVFVISGADNGSFSQETQMYTPQPVGGDCGGGADCINTLCADSVCCGTACGGPGAECERCNLPGSVGTCSVAPAGVVCRPAAGACDVAEACAGGSAACPANAFVADGAACNDGSQCTTVDTCQSGACVGGSPVACSSLDQCHDVGGCDPQTGLCSNPNKADGAACNDNDACTQNDTCQSGACAAGSPVVCSASDQCHEAGACDSQTGACSNPNKANGAACDDSNKCSQLDTCQAGACAGGTMVACPPPSDQCHAMGVCDPSTGECNDPPAFDGTPCDDGDPCTHQDSCQGGSCAPGFYACDIGFACGADSECASGFCVEGVCCESACDGGCSSCSAAKNSVGVDGQCAPITEPGVVCRPKAGACDVEEVCDLVSLDCPPDVLIPAGDVCRESLGICDPAEYCDGVTPGCLPDTYAPGDFGCGDPPDDCHTAMVCEGTGPKCIAPSQPDGTKCSKGKCKDGVCTPPEHVIIDDTPDPPVNHEQESGCSVTTAGGGGACSYSLFAALGLALAALTRPRRR